ncbi:MAG: dienelactone hydrolase family protein [Pseudomonadales bacterium]|nr:dienelactone hydrolase family protein [Pseudomonadales bacterium]
MCDQDTLQDNNEYLRKTGGLSRRQFSKLTAGAGLAMLLPRAANAQDVTESEVQVSTPDGVADAYFVHPASGRHPGVIIWPDILGLRPAFRLMGRRLAESGYSVLVVNPFYRDAKAPVVPEGASFQDEATRNIVMPLAGTLNAQTHTSDARAFVSFLDQQSAVDTSRKIGTMGYCMSGPIILRTAAAVPARVGAAASFHGGGLTSDGADSPHLLIPTMQAQFLIAIAANDDERDPESKNILRESFAKANLKAEIEVYDGTLHGWCPPDSAVYNEAQAERAWSRLLALFDTALA